MSDKELEALKQGMEGATAGLLKPIHELVTKLAGPAVEELGLTWQDNVRVWRFSRAVRLAAKVQELLDVRDAQAFQAVPLKVLLPSLEHASIEDDDNLQDHWATLLANASDSKHEGRMMPVFVEILRQMSSTDALLLSEIYREFDGYDETGPDDEVGNYERLTLHFEAIGRNREENHGLGRGVFFHDLTLSLENLIRLGLLTRRQSSKRDDAYWNLSLNRADQSKEVIQMLYYFTSLGKAFILSCRPPKAARS